MENLIDSRCSMKECKGNGWYDKPVYCLNCGWEGILRQTKGHGSHNISEDCPNCECAGLQFKHLRPAHPVGPVPTGRGIVGAP
jgi:DnaJ-class molecular chaperone